MSYKFFKKEKKLIALVLVIFFFPFSGAVSAKDKVRVIDFEYVFENAKLTKQEMLALENSEDHQGLLKKIQVARAELKTLDEDAVANQLTWSDEQKKQYIQSAKIKTDQIKSLLKEKSQVENAVSKKIQDILFQLSEEFVEKEKIDIVIDRRFVLYRKDDHSVTEKLLKYVDKKTPDKTGY